MKKKKNKVPTRLDTVAKLHKTYDSVTSKGTIIFPSERRALNIKQHVRASHCKNYVTSKPPRGF
jgi:hypothetical protein